MDPPARLGRWHALHAVRARLEFEPGKDPLAGDVGDDFLVAAGVAGALGKDLHAPAVEISIALIHAKKIAGEQRRLVAAGAGADLENGALLVGGVLGEKQEAD